MRTITPEASRYVVIFGGVIFLFLSTSLLPKIDNQLIETLIIFGFCAMITPFFIKAFPSSGQGDEWSKDSTSFLVDWHCNSNRLSSLSLIAYMI